MYLSFSRLLFASLLFSAICKASSDSHFAFLHFFSLVAQTVKRLPTVLETQVRSLGREDLLEKGMATHSSILDPPPKKKGARYDYINE